jgi:hypothetical protein
VVGFSDLLLPTQVAGFLRPVQNFMMDFVIVWRRFLLLYVRGFRCSEPSVQIISKICEKSLVEILGSMVENLNFTGWFRWNVFAVKHSYRKTIIFY